MAYERVIDILVQDANGQAVAVVEVRNLQNLSRANARDIWRDQLQTYAGLSRAPFILLLSQEIGFLWKVDISITPTSAEPTIVFPMTTVVERYALDSQRGEHLRRRSLELLIQQWLINLSWQNEPLAQEPEISLAKVGFLDSVRDTIILHEAHLYDSVR